jgi:predicted nuclease of predicted toxin-antitoxin system
VEDAESEALSVALYMDENVHRAITGGLRLRGVDILTVQEDGRRRQPDTVVLDRAAELGRPLFSQDVDLLIEAQRRQRAGIPFAGVIYAPQTRVAIGKCVQDLELIAEVSKVGELVNRVVFLPL